MMREVEAEEIGQWATFSTFDFTEISPSRAVATDQWPPPLEELSQVPSGETTLLNMRQDSVDESLVDVSDDQRDDDWYESERLLEMEKEQDMLNASLMSLTTHFAQVQFRLKQISGAADIETKEKLIKELELFAFEGCPDVRGVVPKSPKRNSIHSEAEHEETHQKQVVETKELIQRLQKQLTDVEQWAYESGQAEPPSLAVLERQKLILDTLRERVKLSIDGYEHLPAEQLRIKIDEAIEAIISPYRKKEVAQERSLSNMQTLVDDLERYINHMHQPGAGKADLSVAVPSCSTPAAKSGGGSREPVDPRSQSNGQTGAGYVTNFIHRTYNVLQFFAFMNWACINEKRFQKNVMKTTTKGNHWGDVRAVLELAVSRVIETVRLQSATATRSGRGRIQHFYQDQVAVSEDQLTKVVRKDLAAALCNLMKHGLIHLSSETSLVPRIMCTSRNTEPTELHPWDFLLKYYNYKKGNEFNRSATKKLADSFQLSSVGANAITPLETLLSTIGEIIQSHEKFKRSAMTHFKAFVCAGLNRKSLSVWLRLIYCTKPVIDEYYMPWSYAVKTHFEDACRSLDGLNDFEFSLCADLAVKPFSSLNDAF